MALKAQLENLDGLDEATSALYKQDGERFILDVEGVNGFALEDVGGLKTALGKERKTAKEATDALARYKDPDSGELLDPEAARAASARVTELEAIDPDKEADKLAKEKIASAKQAITKDFEGKLREKDERINVVMGALERSMVDGKITEVLNDTEVRGIAKGLLPIMRPNISLREAEPGRFVAQVTDAQGDPKLNGQGDPMSIKEYALELRKDEDLAGLFLAENKSGGGGTQNGGARQPGSKDKGNQTHGASRIARGLRDQSQVEGAAGFGAD